MSLLALALLALGQADAPANLIYRDALERGLVVEGVEVKLPEPILRAGMTEADRRTALKGAVDLPIDEFLRDSPNAPFKLKLRDVPYPGGVVRVVDLWFAVHASLDEIDLDQLAGKADLAGRETTEEVGNMRFSARILTDADLKTRSIAPAAEGLDRRAFSRGVLLDKVEVSSVNHVVASKANGSLVIASRTDPAFDLDPTFPNRWSLLPAPGAKKEAAAPKVYVGSVGYTRVDPLSEKPAILLVESHLAFAEPKGWFNGASILRSKMGLIAQDQIRKLRREIAARRKGPAKP
jgi:hypothetical protein